MAPPTQPKSSDEHQTSRNRLKAAQRNEEANSSVETVETVLHRPPTHKENLPPHLPSTIRGLPAGIHQVIGFPLRDTFRTSFNQAITQEANWPLPDSIVQGLKYQANRYEPPQPRVYTSAAQSAQTNQNFDPDDGNIYSQCSECDPSGGPTDCQHPEDPPYSSNLNPIRDDDPAFNHLKRIQWPLVTPKEPSPAARLITKPSPSKVAVIREHVSPRSPSLDSQDPLSNSPTANRRGILRAQAKLPARSGPFPDEMLAARHLSNFLTENVEEGVATSYVIFTMHGTLLGYSSGLPVTTARSIAAAAGLTWRQKDQHMMRDPEADLRSGSANFLKVHEVTKAEQGPGLFNMICERKDFIMSVQWIQSGFLVAAMIKNDAAPPSASTTAQTGFQLGAGANDDGDGNWEDEDAVEETSEDDEDKAKQFTKTQKLLAKSQGLAEALREQWKLDEFKMPPGFR
ncbi:MAG: hypothetical protein L6R37_001694 [Teloschistes peruensis]|nr:MAG: hypothetical protein L6R37_001694 [Teloschistes peruensis]